MLSFSFPSSNLHVLSWCVLFLFIYLFIFVLVHFNATYILKPPEDIILIVLPSLCSFQFAQKFTLLSSFPSCFNWEWSQLPSPPLSEIEISSFGWGIPSTWKAAPPIYYLSKPYPSVFLFIPHSEEIYWMPTMHQALFGAVLSNGTFWDYGHVLYLHCPVG